MAGCVGWWWGWWTECDASVRIEDTFAVAANTRDHVCELFASPAITAIKFGVSVCEQLDQTNCSVSAFQSIVLLTPVAMHGWTNGGKLRPKNIAVTRRAACNTIAWKEKQRHGITKITQRAFLMDVCLASA